MNTFEEQDREKNRLEAQIRENERKRILKMRETNKTQTQAMDPNLEAQKKRFQKIKSKINGGTKK